MLRRKYHYLVAGLPDLSFGEQIKNNSIPDYCEQLKNQLDPADYEQVKLALLVYDNENLIAFLKSGETNFQYAGNFDAETFLDQVEHSPSVLSETDLLPVYMLDLIRDHYDKKSAQDFSNYEKILAEGYYNHVMDSGTKFLKKINEFQYNMKNLLATIQAGKYDLFNKGIVVGDNSLADHLRRVGGKNIIPDSEFEFFNELVTYSGNESFAEAERKYDLLCWKIIDESLFFEYFTTDRLLGHLLKLQIISRWGNLNHDSGERKLRQMIAVI